MLNSLNNVMVRFELIKNSVDIESVVEILEDALVVEVDIDHRS